MILSHEKTTHNHGNTISRFYLRVTFLTDLSYLTSYPLYLLRLTVAWYKNYKFAEP
jgi:hypothetical protein